MNREQSASLRGRLAGSERRRSASSWARSRRWAMMLRYFPDLADMSVLDLGGTVQFWQQAPRLPRSVTVLNPALPTVPVFDGVGGTASVAAGSVRFVVGDACEPPTEVRSSSYDIVFSNSCIEHVGGHQRRIQFARTVHRAAPRAWIQTPYRYFPLEPHWMVPFGQQLPTPLRAEIVRRWPLRPAGFPSSSRRDALAEVMGVELLTASDLVWYFPGAHIWRERIAGLTKSLVAVVSAD